MRVTYIHHSGFLVETRQCYWLFDYEKGDLPEMDREKPVFVLSSHGHSDHYTPEVFPALRAAGMGSVRGILSDDIPVPENVEILQVSAGKVYSLAPGQILTTFASTDLGVAFLVEDGDEVFYHAGDLNDWVWDEETEAYNAQMTADYRHQIRLLAKALKGRALDAAFVVLDPRQERDYDRGLCFFLENVPVKRVWPMHYWGEPGIIRKFLEDHPVYADRIEKTE